MKFRIFHQSDNQFVDLIEDIFDSYAIYKKAEVLDLPFHMTLLLCNGTE